MSASIEFRNVTKSYRKHEVLKGLDMSIEAGSFSILFGGPGCGKSVVLRLLTGLEKPTSGEIFMRGENVVKVSPGDRRIGYIPQSFALYPHYKVYDNIAYPLTLSRTPKDETRQIVERVAEMLRITKLLNKMPNQLSGGEKQRVAIARGIANQTDIFVFDDPLTGLDFKLREQLFEDLKDMQAALKATFLYTTSDALEALILANEINILHDGRCVEAGPLGEVFTCPQNVHSMELLGFPKATLVKGTLVKENGHDVCKTPLFDLPALLNKPASGDVLVGIRPQDVVLDRCADGMVTTPAKVLLKEDLGGELVVHLEVNGHNILSVVRHDDVCGPIEDSTTIGVAPTTALLFDSTSGQRIGQGGY